MRRRDLLRWLASVPLVGAAATAEAGPWWRGNSVTPSGPPPQPPPPTGGPWPRKGSTLSADVFGWCMDPDVAVDSSGNLYAVWKQDYIASNNTRAQVRGAKYSGGAWAALAGGGVNYTITNDGSVPFGPLPVNEPRIAMLDTTPYVCWQESTGYYSGVFVAHHSGSAWVQDAGPGHNGGVSTTLVTDPDVGNAAIKPVLCNVGGTIMLAYFLSRSSNGQSPQVKIKKLIAGTWSDDATISLGSGDMGMCLDFEIGTSNAWLMLSMHDGARTINVWERTGAGTWVQRGRDWRSSTNTRAPQAALAVIGNVPYVAMAEGTFAATPGEMGAPDQLLVKHWNGSAVVADGGANNVSATKHAGRPALATDGTNLWLAWCESARGEKALLYARQYTVASATWQTIAGGLNVNTGFSADSPRLVALAGVANVIWSERASGGTKQIYVAGTDAATATAPAAPAAFGINGTKPTLVDNAWQYLTPAKGIAAVSTSAVSDESFDATVYCRGINKTVFYGHYHTGELGTGECQNGLLAYDFALHRLDLLEITDAAYNEHFVGHGHDEGNMTYDPTHDLIVARGAKSLYGIESYRMYCYDPAAGRGKRMMPLNPAGDHGADFAIAAFDTARDRALMWVSTGGVLYDPHANAVVATVPLPPGQAAVFAPGLVYDNLRDLYIMFGGSNRDSAVAANCFNTVWSLAAGNPGAGWTQRTMTGTLPAVRSNPSMAFDSLNGITMVAGGRTAENEPQGFIDSFLLNSVAWSWTSAGNVPVTGGGQIHAGGAGNMMVYDSTAGCFLLRENQNVANWFRYKYPGSFSMPLKTWVAQSMNTMPKPPGAYGMGYSNGVKHGSAATRTVDGRTYFFGGDWYSYSDANIGGDGNGSMTTWSTNFTSPSSWRQEWPPDGTSNIPNGQIGPNWPDESGWVYDAARDRFIAIEGFWNKDYNSQTLTVRADPENSTTKFRVVNAELVSNNIDGSLGLQQKVVWLTGALVGSPSRAIVNILLSNSGGTNIEPDQYIVVSPAMSGVPQAGDTFRGARSTATTGVAHAGCLIYDPTAKTWALPPWPSPVGGYGGEGHGPRSVLIDPVTDQLMMFVSGGVNGSIIRNLHLSGARANTWEPTAGLGPPAGAVQTVWYYDKSAVIDVVGRHVYAMDVNNRRLIKFNIDSRVWSVISVPSMYKWPAQVSSIATDNNSVNVSFDTKARRLLFVCIVNSLWDTRAYAVVTYNVDTATWTDEGLVQPSPGSPVHGNMIVYDPINNVHMLMGQENAGSPECSSSQLGCWPTSPYYYLYRYVP
jgi:hypothetical protein